jgi:glutamate-1-semialdehyde 2,1-aminomutase
MTTHTGTIMDFSKSLSLVERFHSRIPGGSHTYAKGDDQYPAHMLPYVVRGEGCRMWDVDANEFIEWGMGLRAVTLGHAYPPVVEAARRAMLDGTNFIRPTLIELEAAEALLDIIQGADMVKFSKDGSDATSGAVRVSRAYTGRDLVARCANQPFFSVDDWFIGSTPMSAGIPAAIRELTVSFRYNDIESVEQLFERYPDRLACVILEPEKYDPSEDGFLEKLRALCDRHGTVLIFDEMITGFRWHLGGAQAFYKVVPDLSAWGKGMANGFSVSALAGKKEIMELGGLLHDKERVFLLSGTHSAETHGLAAAMATMKVFREEPVIETMWKQGQHLADGLERAIADQDLESHIGLFGRPCCLVYGTKDAEGHPSQPFRTLLLQEVMKRGVIAPSLIISYSHDDEAIDRTVQAFHGAFRVYRKALDEGIDVYLESRPVQAVWRTFNDYRLG